jgi:hypothetical protein
MSKQFYAIYDRIAERYTFLFESENDATASRLFQKEQQRDGSMICESPEDFTLWHTAEFNDKTAEFTNKAYKVADGKPKE